MDYFFSSRQDNFDDTNTLMVVSQILNNIHDVPANEFQDQVREQLISTLRRTNLPGAGSVNTWAAAVNIAKQQGEAFANYRPTSGPFAFEAKALNMSEVTEYFDDPDYTGPPMVMCLITGASGRTCLLQNKKWPSAPGTVNPVDKYCINTTTEGVRSVPVGNVSLASPQQELSCMSFFDENRSVVDWATTLKSLKQHAQDSEYSSNMCKSALLSMIRMYRPLDQEILAEKTADQIARYLLDATSSVDRKLYHLDRLEKQTRKPGEPLQEAVAKVKLIAGRIYPESPSHRDRIVIRALMSFVDQTAAKMLSRALSLAQQKGIDPNVDKLTEDVVRYELQTGKHPNQTMAMSRNSGLLPTFMAMKLHDDREENIWDPPGSFMANKTKPVMDDREDERRKYLWHFDQAAVKSRDSARQRQSKLKQPLQENQAFFTMPHGKPHLYFPNQNRDGYLKLDTYTLPNPEMFVQAVDFSAAGPAEEGDPFLKQLQGLRSARPVTQNALNKAKTNRQTVGKAVIEYATKTIAEMRERYNTRSAASLNATKSNPPSRGSSPGGNETSAFSTPNTSRNSSRSRGSVKDGVYSRDGSKSRSPSAGRSTEKPKSSTPKKPPGRKDSVKGRVPRLSTSQERRDRSGSSTRYQDMKRGVNCRPTYNPDKGKSCTKCMTTKYDEGAHFEFRCPIYDIYNKDACTVCYSGYHKEDACRDGTKTFPPPNLNENNAVLEQAAGNAKLQELQKALLSLLNVEKNG